MALDPRRVRHPHRSRLDETARGSIARDDIKLPKERKRTTIVREGEPAILNFDQIKNLAAQWDERLVPID